MGESPKLLRSDSSRDAVVCGGSYRSESAHLQQHQPRVAERQQSVTAATATTISQPDDLKCRIKKACSSTATCYSVEETIKVSITCCPVLPLVSVILIAL